MAGATLGAMVLGAGAAQAAVGTQPGAVNLNPTTGATTSTPTWATTVACPSGSQGSAVFREVHSDGTTTNNISTATNSVTAAFSGTLQANMAQIQASGGIPNGGTQELVVVCFSGPSGQGTATPYMDIFVTYSADGSTYATTTTPPPPPGGTTTTLTANPASVAEGGTFTMSATEAASDGSHPAGSIQFEVGGTALGAPVAVDANGAATSAAATAPTTPGTLALSAVFTPTSSSFTGSTGNATETVTGSNQGAEPLAVTVPASGTFTFTVAAGTVNLAVSGSNATGALNAVTVSDTRNTFPGWSIAGQVANFTGSGTATISGNQLGWVPTDTALGTGATLGGTVAPGSPGLGTTAATLASATAGNGSGTSTLGANLTLAIPASAAAGAYTSTLTLTATTTG